MRPRFSVHAKLAANLYISLCNSTNAVSFSSLRTIKRFPWSQCALVTKTVRLSVASLVNARIEWIRDKTSRLTPDVQVQQTLSGLSSACTMKRLPSPRCASTIQIVRPSESRAETQPKLHPALLSLSAMISQYFTLRILPLLCSTPQRENIQEGGGHQITEELMTAPSIAKRSAPTRKT